MSERVVPNFFRGGFHCGLPVQLPDKQETSEFVTDSLTRLDSIRGNRDHTFMYCDAMNTVIPK